jgi:hypothetical protein
MDYGLGLQLISPAEKRTWEYILHRKTIGNRRFPRKSEPSIGY